MTTIAVQHDNYTHAQRGWAIRCRVVLEETDAKGVRLRPLGRWCNTVAAARLSARKKLEVLR